MKGARATDKPNVDAILESISIEGGGRRRNSFQNRVQHGNGFLTAPARPRPTATDTDPYAHTHAHTAELSWGELEGGGVPSVPLVFPLFRCSVSAFFPDFPF